MKSLAVVVATIATLVAACGDDHNHEHAHAKRSQPGATQPNVWPTTPLVWGDVNFIHTTDSHGWLIGHTKATYPEPNYSGDFGDFSSFVTHMKLQALERGVDLLLIDSGDLHDGTGLSDGYPSGGTDGHESNKFFFDLPYDILAIGNHELYDYNVAYDMWKNFAPKWNGKYLSSNVNITVNDSTGAAVSVPVGSRYRKFKTLFGRKVTALGVLYNFSGNSANTTVQYVANMVKESWFIDAIQEAPDFFLLVGHMPVSKDNWPTVFNAIRAVHPTTPIVIFGGHTHIRDCTQLDSRSMSLESGRYMETLGWMSMKLPKHDTNSSAPLNFTRRYLDPNRNTYKFHTGAAIFDTPVGVAITKGITALSKAFNISYVFGTAPQDYYLSRVPFPSNQSVLSLFADEVMPTALSIVNPNRSSVPFTAIANAGSQRFDLYAGEFTRNDQFVVSPFNDNFLYVTVPYSVGSQVLTHLNGGTAPGRKRLFDKTSSEEMIHRRFAQDTTFEPRGRRWLGTPDAPETEEEYARGVVDGRYNQWLKDQWEKRDDAMLARAEAIAAAVNTTLSLGYVTSDSCPGVGDDVAHTPIPYYGSPNYIGSPLPTGLAPTDLMDVVFLDFFESSVLSIVNGLQTTKNYTASDVFSYGNAQTNTVFGIFAEAKWN
ncbi:hypothetical protein DL93DRAFT_2065823 [Clavulina sp. PMI_390]|nr:hypothetical protein DL93DRAFT_2065823 [Clavulina sp. PMI_390]